MVVKKGGFLFTEGKDSILFYQKTPTSAAGRCNYIPRVYGLNGSKSSGKIEEKSLTKDGIFWGWPLVMIDNKLVSDTWNYNNIQQKVSNFEYVLNNGIALVKTTTDWKSPEWKNGAEAYLKEETQISIYPQAGNYRKIEFEIKLKALTDRVSISGSENYPGGLSFTFNLVGNEGFSGEKLFSETESGIVTAGKFVRMDRNSQKENKPTGIILAKNESTEKPNEDYFIDRSNGILNATFPGNTQISVPFDKPLVIRYTLIVFQQELTNRQIEKAIRSK
jgi:hypothetical protein